MTREEAIELIPLYAVGALDADEARVMEDFLRDASSGDLQELAEWRDVVSVLPMGLPEAAPSESVKTRLMARIAEETESAPELETAAKVLPFTPARKLESTPMRWMLMAASLLLALSSVYLYLRSSQFETERDRLASALKAEQNENSELLASLNAATRVIAMDDPTKGANAKVIWDTKRQVWSVYINLPTLPSDQDYQLWYVTNKSQKISAAVFRTDQKGKAVLSLTLPPQAIGGLAATAITVEPKGGSEEPTSTPKLQSAI